MPKNFGAAHLVHGRRWLSRIPDNRLQAPL
jgi:hypothetical protein